MVVSRVLVKKIDDNIVHDDDDNHNHHHNSGADRNCYSNER